jgi:hypothetical protein
LSIPLLYFICESPKFLLTKNGERDEEAYDVIYKILPEDQKYLLSKETKELISFQYRTFMNTECKHKNLYKEMLTGENIKLSIFLFVLWYIVSYVYYGLIYILPSIYEKLEFTKKKNENLNTESYDRIVSDIIISCIFEIPSDILNGILPTYFDKKYIIIGSFIGSSIFSFLSCFMIPLIPLFSSINKGFINTAFTVLYIYTSEAYPTYMRTTSLGTCNFFSRIGGFTTPFICEYLLSLNIQAPFIGFGFGSLLGIVITFLLPKICEKNIF